MIKISLKCVLGGSIDNNSALIKLMVWHHTDDRPLPEPILTRSLMPYGITGPQYLKGYKIADGIIA